MRNNLEVADKHRRYPLCQDTADFPNISQHKGSYSFNLLLSSIQNSSVASMHPHLFEIASYKHPTSLHTFKEVTPLINLVLPCFAFFFLFGGVIMLYDLITSPSSHQSFVHIIRFLLLTVSLSGINNNMLPSLYVFLCQRDCYQSTVLCIPDYLYTMGRM